MNGSYMKIKKIRSKNCKSVSNQYSSNELYSKARGDIIMLKSDISQIAPKSFFNDQEVEVVFFPSTIKEIGDYAFSECYNLRELIFDENCSLIRIGKHAFSGCKSLETVSIPNSVQIVDTAAFKACLSLKSIHFSESSSADTIGAYAFEDCTSLVSINIPNRVKVIQESTFYNCCSLRELIIPVSVLVIKEFAFFTKGPLKLQIEGSNVLIDDLALYGIPVRNIKRT